jgi:hypothetical protein
MIAHEDDPVVDKEGIVQHISVMLGGKLVNNMTFRLSEIWWMSQDVTGDKKRRLAVNPTRKRRPIKTRMFSHRGQPEFELKYDADRPDKGQMTIASWYDLWEKGGMQKLEVPK